MSKILTFRGQQKQEALKRMVKLSLEPEIIVEFMENNTVYLSAQGVKFFLEDDEKKIVEEFEKEWNSVVYYVIRESTSVGELLTLFYVSEHTDEWDKDNADIERNLQNCYVKNSSYEHFSEFGYVGFVNLFGNLIRTV